MNKEKSKFKIFLRKVLRVLYKVWKKICTVFKNLWASFMSLKSYVRAIVYVWVAIAVVLVAFILLSNSNNKFVKAHEDIELAIKNATLDYVKSNNVYPTEAKPVKLSLDMLKLDNYIYESDITDKSCKGYSTVYYDDEHYDYKVKSYINCDKYTTDGYKN